MFYRNKGNVGYELHIQHDTTIDKIQALHLTLQKWSLDRGGHISFSEWDSFIDFRRSCINKKPKQSHNDKKVLVRAPPISFFEMGLEK